MGSINYLAVAVATVASVGVGMVWFADPVFGRAWKRMHGITEPAKPTASAFVIWVVGAFLLAYTLYRLLYVKMATASMGDALLVGLLIAVGVVIAGMAPNYAFAKKPLGLAGIELGYVCLSIMLMSAILAAWQ